MNLVVAKYRKNENVPDATYQLAEVYRAMGEHDQARFMAQRVVRRYGEKSPQAAEKAQAFLAKHYP